MKVSDFDYDLPSGLIAQRPLGRRDASRMMILDRKSKEIFHSRFSEFPGTLRRGDVVVVNDTRVFPARLWGKKNGSSVEFLFLEEAQKSVWKTICRPARKIKRGDVIVFSPSLQAEITEAEEEGKRTIRLSTGDVRSELKKIGFAPLPPYIKRRPQQTDMKDFDRQRYQTVFARKYGAVAAPTAGLHFTPLMLRRLEDKGVELVRITLDVGPATFRPVRVETVEEHRMFEESYSVSRRSAKIMNAAKSESRPVLAVGTTTVRTLESACRNGKIREGSGKTDLFIYPGFEFRAVDRILTNFHLPKSTLLMMIAAFGGHKLVKKAYLEAIKNKYRFYSYGDCMLII